MAVLRQALWYGGGRVDAPHLRLIESGVAGDFDLLAGLMIGGGTPLIVKGFDVITTNAINAFATSLQVNVANSLLIHYLASESGSIFSVPSTRAIETLSSTNARVIGGFTANATNYIGLDLRRSSDSSTADIVQFINTITKAENPERVALARTLDYVFIISTSDFGSLSSVCPIAKVVTDSSNRATTITDARPMLGRLGAGGTVPNTKYAYTWPGGRAESGGFNDADKRLNSLKGWLDAAMTRMWELGGGEYWYSPTADRNVTMMRAGTTFTNGEWFEWSGTNLHWRGLTMVFSNSTGWKNTITDQTADASDTAGTGYGSLGTHLNDGDCIYVDIDRTQNATITAAKGQLTTLGTPTVPGSRYILAWRNGTSIFTRGSSFPVGSTFNIATNTSLGIVQLTVAAANPSIPLVVPVDGNGTLANTATTTGFPGVQGVGLGAGTGVAGTGGTTNGAGGTFVGGTGGPGAVGLGQGGSLTGGINTKMGVVGVGGGGTSAFAGGTNGVGVYGIGFSAPGVLGIGGNNNAAASGGDFTGGSAAPALVTHGLALNDQPSYIAKDQGGNVRWLVDHLGFPASRCSQFREEWIGATVGTGAPPAWWTTATGTGTSVTVGYGGTTLGAMAMSSSLGTTNLANGYTYTAQQFFNPTTTTVMALEFEVLLTGTGGNFGFGFSDLVDPSLNSGSGANCIKLLKLASTAHYLVYTGGAGANIDANVSPTGGTTFDRIRIEWHGSATPIGVAAVEGQSANTGKVRVFINETRQVTTVFSGSTTAMSLVLGGRATTVAGTAAIGPILVNWTRFLNNPAL